MRKADQVGMHPCITVNFKCKVSIFEPRPSVFFCSSRAERRPTKRGYSTLTSNHGPWPTICKLSLRVNIAQQTASPKGINTTLSTVSVNSPLSSNFSFHILNLISMRFSFFAVLSGLAALAVVSALPAENLQRDVPSEDINCSGESDCSGQQPTYLDCHDR